MRFSFFILVITFLATGFKCFSQKKDGELIPLLKQSYKIDSLLITIVDDDSAFMKKYPCLIIDVVNQGNALTLNIGSYNKRVANEIIAKNHSMNTHIGYFEFKGFKAFVFSAKRFENLFLETKNTKRIDFLDFSAAEGLKIDDILNVPYLALFMYQNGKFSIPEPMH